MFKKRITPFACILICIAICIASFVGFYARFSVAEKAEINQLRLENAKYSQYTEFIETLGEDSDKYAKLSLLFDLIEGNCIHDFDDDEVWTKLYKSLVYSIGDKYAEYLTNDEYEALMDSSDGDFVGIGVHVTFDVDEIGVYVFGVIPDSPAEKSGIKRGDVIKYVEDVEVTEENYYEALDLVRGKSGTDVKLTVLRDGETIDFTVTRAAVGSENVFYEKTEDGIAYIRILSFADSTVSEEFTAKLAQAQNEGCEKFIFDVRNNGGGYLDEICDILDILLPEGPIINIVYKSGEKTTVESDANFIDAPMAVICNENTASAAELFTAALRDYNMAEIIGVTTFGKGSMQTTKILSDGSAVKISTALYNPPSNVSYDGIGVVPDHVIELDEKWKDRFFKLSKEEDKQYQKALEIIKAE